MESTVEEIEISILLYNIKVSVKENRQNCEMIHVKEIKPYLISTFYGQNNKNSVVIKSDNR